MWGAKMSFVRKIEWLNDGGHSPRSVIRRALGSLGSVLPASWSDLG